MAYCGYVTTLKNVRKHPNAERLLLAECFGNTVSVNLDYFEGLTNNYNKFVNICNNNKKATKEQILSGMYKNKKYCGLKINVKEKRV